MWRSQRERLAELFGDKILPRAAVTGHFILAVEFTLAVVAVDAITMAILNTAAFFGWLYAYAKIDWESIGNEIDDQT